MGLLDSIQKHCQENKIENDAITSFLKDGFPTTKDEEWKYTSLKKVISEDYFIKQDKAQISSGEIEKSSLNFGHQIIFLNGEIHKMPQIEGVLIEKNSFSNLALSFSSSNISFVILNVCSPILTVFPASLFKRFCFLTKASVSFSSACAIATGSAASDDLRIFTIFCKC